MPPTTPNADERKMLPGGTASPPPPATPSAPVVVTREITATSAPTRQLSELPKDELDHLAEEFGLDPKDYKTRQHLVAAIHDRRQMIASFEREAMLDVVRWGRRPVLASST